MSDGRRWLLLGALALLVAAGCEVHNKNSVNCHDEDCEASCEALGYPGGACDDENECVCDEGDAGPYDWNGGSDGDTDADSDTDTSGDAG